MIITSFLKVPIKAFIPVIPRLLLDGSSNHVIKKRSQGICIHGWSQFGPCLGEMPFGLISFCCGQIFLYGWQMSCTQIFGFSWANLDEVHHPQSWRGHMRSLWEVSLFHWASNMCTKFIIYLFIFWRQKANTANARWIKTKENAPTPRGGGAPHTHNTTTWAT